MTLGERDGIEGVKEVDTTEGNEDEDEDAGG